MKLWKAIAFLCLVWAAIYLPMLGSQELRGEEARRILPAQEMLKSGDWIVPRIAGEVYSNKPPLINWAIAASFFLTGSQSEFAARLPSVLSVLFLAVSGLLFLRSFLGTPQATAVGLVLLSSIAMIDKCRMAEIESLYIALFGIACFCWINCWASKKSAWLVWTVPYFFLGLGWLAKGPVHLLFWILFVVSILACSRKWRDMLHPAHLFGIAIMALLFLPWMNANLAAVGAPDQAVGTWKEQLAMRFEFEGVNFSEWSLRPLEILGNFLPWSIPLVFAWMQIRRGNTIPEERNGDDRFDAVIRGCLIAFALSCLLIWVLPAGRPRYVMPAFPVAALATVGLYFQISPNWRARYAKWTRVSFFLLVPLIMIFLVGSSIRAAQENLELQWIFVIPGFLILSGLLIHVSKQKELHHLFFVTSLFLATGTMSVIAAVLPFQREHRSMEETARSLATLAKTENRTLVIYADESFREGYTKELRLIYYLDTEGIAIGENGIFPEGPLLVAGRPKFEKSIRRSQLSGRKPGERSSINIDGRQLSLLEIE